MPRTILPFRRPLIYPGIAPGVDLGHIASKGQLRFSGVPVAKTFINLLSPRAPSSISGTSYSITTLGPSVFVGAADTIQFSGQPTVAPVSATAAAIYTMADVSTFRSIFSNSAATTGSLVGLFGSDGSNLMCRVGGSNFNSSVPIPVAANIPYFAIVSYHSVSGIINFTLVRLDTGQIINAVDASAGTQPITSDGTYLVGQWAGTGLGANGNIAAVMYSENSYLSLTEMYAWAQDPWAFWYPRKFGLTNMLSPAIIAAAPPTPRSLLQTRNVPGLGPRSRHTALLNAALPAQPIAPPAAGGTLPFMGVG